MSEDRSSRGGRGECAVCFLGAPGKTVVVPQLEVDVFNALRSLVEERAFDKITVRSICERANVSKSSFYQHFSDKYSIMQWHYDLVTNAGTAQIGRTLSWRGGHLITTAGIAPYVSVYDSAGLSTTYEGLLAYSLRKRKNDIYQTLTNYRHVRITDRLEFQIDALVGAEQAAAKSSFSKIETMGVSEFADCMVSLVPRELFEALEISPGESPSEEKNPWASLFAV